MRSDKFRDDSFLWVNRQGKSKMVMRALTGNLLPPMNWKVAITSNTESVSRATFPQVIHVRPAHKFSRFFVARKSAGAGIQERLGSAVVENLLHTSIFALGT